jgi:phosphonopyruvate decarboxylase
MVYHLCKLKGDGALLMHGGSLAVIGTSKAKNFKHIVFNNEAHDSVGA